MIDAIIHGFYHYFNFSKRTSRAFFWWWTLFTVIIYILASLYDYHSSGTAIIGEYGTAYIIVSIVFIVPTLSITARRLHDINMSGWWQLLYITGIGYFVVLYFCTKRSDVSVNKYGAW